MAFRHTPEPPQTSRQQATYIVAADAGRARIFSVSRQSGELTEIADLLDPEVRVQDHDSLSDRRGHASHGPAPGATGIGHSFEPRQSHEEHAALAFARQVCEALDKARLAGEMKRLYLIAAPAFLGLLRKHMGGATQACVVQELASDLTRRHAADIRAALPTVL
jgi:protein required for attachment to host cells